MNRLPEGLDQRFLQFIGVTEDSERRTHAFYLKFFRPGQQVLDLGCGAGYFVKMLREQGVEAQGLDRDPKAVAEARAQAVPIIQAEVMDYLNQLPDQSLDAIFSAHLVEHLEAADVYTLFQEVYRVLKTGGFLLVTTPNVRALVSHLEMFWLHFGHTRFYHPRLLEFFMRECQFSEVSYGENYPKPDCSNFSGSTRNLDWNLVIPRPRYFFMRPWWWFKRWLAQLVVLPYLAAVIPLQVVERSFEVYVLGYKYAK